MNHCLPSLSLGLLRFGHSTPLFRNLNAEVFSGWLKEGGRFPSALSSRPPRTRLSPCGDDVRASALSVALRRFFLRPVYLIIDSCACAQIHKDRFPLLCICARLLLTM